MTTDDDLSGKISRIYSKKEQEEEENVWPLMLFNDPPLRFYAVAVWECLKTHESGRIMTNCEV